MDDGKQRKGERKKRKEKKKQEKGKMVMWMLIVPEICSFSQTAASRTSNMYMCYVKKLQCY